MSLRLAVVACGILLVAGPGAAGGPAAAPEGPPKPADRTPVELGRIAWLRGFDVAARRAAAEKKPLLVLFDEVPGCATCVNYGRRVLSHPLIREAAETCFVPVAVFNNIKGDDERTLKRFQEPAWNNPVVRIMTHEGKPLAPRVADDTTVAGLATAMAAGLAKANRDVPTYLALLAEEAAARKRGTARATFAMHCFWEGEGALGGVRGVISTLPGFLNKEEVVEVEFDPATIDYAALVSRARALDCASHVFARDDVQQKAAARLVGAAAIRSDAPIRPDKQPKYYLSGTLYRHVPMTGLQAARVNARIGRKQPPDPYLSPGQLRLLATIRKHPDAKWPDALGASDLVKAWSAAERVAGRVARGDRPPSDRPQAGRASGG